MKTKHVRCAAWIAALTLTACGGDDTIDPDAGALDAAIDASRDGEVDAGTDADLDGGLDGDDGGLDAADGLDAGPPPPYYLLTNSRSDPSEYYRLDEAGGPPVSLGGEPDFSPGLMTFDRANGVLYAITGVLGEGHELHRVDLCGRTHEVVGMLANAEGMPARIVEGLSWRESTGELWIAFGFEVGFISDMLAVVDPDTGALSVVTSISDTTENELDHIMWGNDGVLYGRDANGTTINRFYSVDPVTGIASEIGELGVQGGSFAQNPDTGFVAFTNPSAALASLDLTDGSSTEIVEVYEELMGRDLVYVNTVCPDP